jgi:hypothetical protein
MKADPEAVNPSQLPARERVSPSQVLLTPADPVWPPHAPIAESGSESRSLTHEYFVDGSRLRRARPVPHPAAGAELRQR